MVLDRNLASINRKLLKRSSILQTTIRERLAAGGPVSVLEVGCGVGAALMELAWEFRSENVRLHGINRDAGEPLDSREDLRRTARELKIASPEELEALRLPELFFEDATRMHYEGESFDVVFASSVLRFVPEKAAFLEEIGRVLKPGGTALVRISGKNWNYPYSIAADDVTLTTSPSRWVLYHGRELIPLDAYLRAAADDRFEFEFLNAPACVVRMRKLASGHLDLGLRFDPERTLEMRQLPYGDDRIGYAKGGVRSAYEVPEGPYRRLFERGHLSRGTLRESGRGEIRYEDDANGERNRERLARYRLGQRIKIKGRLDGGVLQAAKIKMIPDEQAPDHLEGVVEGIDEATGGLSVLGILVDPGDAAIADVEVGTNVRVEGRYSGSRFDASSISRMPRPAIQVDQLQACIEDVDAETGVLRVANTTVTTTPSTKIDRPNRR